MTRRQLDPAGKLALWALGLLVVSLVVHVANVSTPGLLDRSGRLKASDYMRLYVTGAIAAEARWSVLFDAAAHVQTAKDRIDPRIEMAGLHPNYGPAAAWLLAPISRLPFLTSWAAFTLASSAALLIGIWALAGQSDRLRRRRALAVLVAAASPALFIAARYGQLSAITAALFAAAATLHWRGHAFGAGICVGLVAYKPNLVLPAAVIWTLSRQWRLLGGLIAGAAAHLGLGVLVAGPEATAAWFRVLADLARSPQLVQGFPEEVHSWQGFWRLLGVSGVWLRGLTASTSLAAAGLAAWTWTRTTDPAIRWASLVVATLLISPHLLTYDLLLLVMPLLLAAGTVTSRIAPTGWACLLLWLYLSPLVSPLLAALTGVQSSTLAMASLLAGLAWRATRSDSRSSSMSPSISSYADSPTTIHSIGPPWDQ